MAETGDRAQVRNVFFALRACFDQYLDSLIDTHNDLIEVLSQRLEIRGKSNQTLERHAECLTQGTQFGTALDQSINLALLRRGRHPRVQIGMFVRHPVSY